MMCWHRWNKWGEPEYRNVTRTYTYYPRIEESREQVQERTCKKCGKYHWKIV